MHASLAASPIFYHLRPPPIGAFFIELSFPIVVAILLVALFLLGMAFRGGAFLHRRRGEISAMAARLNLHPWPDDSLPRGLSLEGTHFHHPHKLTNVFDGVINRKEVVILDIQKQERKSHWSRTIIAIHSHDRVNTPPGLESHQAGGWRLIYSPVAFSGSAELIEVDKLESLLRNIIQ